MSSDRAQSSSQRMIFNKAVQKHLDAFIEHHVEKTGNTQQTTQAYYSDLEQFFNFSSKPPLEVTPIQICRFLVYLKTERGYTNAGLKRKLATLRSFYQFLRQKKILVTDPTIDISIPWIGQRLSQAVTPMEAKRLLSAAKSEGPRTNALVHLFYDTGLDMEEASEFNIEDIDLDHGMAWIRGQGQKGRIVLLTPSVTTALRIYLETRSVGPLFVNHQGHRLTPKMIEQLINATIIKADLSSAITSETLQETFMVRTLERGADLWVLQELLEYATLSSHSTESFLQSKHRGEVFSSTLASAKSNSEKISEEGH